MQNSVMGVLEFVLIASAAAASPQVELSTLEGAEHQGELADLNATALTLKQDDGELKLPLADLLGVRFVSAEPLPPPDRRLSRVVFYDGTRFGCSGVTASGRQAVLDSPQLGKVEVPRQAVESVRFDSDPVVDEAWQKLRDRERKRDLLVVKKKGEVVVLDFLEGIVGAIGEEEIRFLFGGDEIPVQRGKVFGVIYADRQAEPAKPVCEVLLHNSGRLPVKQIAFSGGEARATLLAGADVRIAPETIRELDFSLGKVRYLSQMEPREVNYTPFFDEDVHRWLIQYRRDMNPDRRPLQLGNKTYARGLCIHSKTSLVYRINTDYRRLKAVVGIDYAMAKEGAGDVHVVIYDATDRSDKKVLFEANVRGTDKPREIDLDVSEVRDLEILVDYGSDGLDISDWLDLADARVTK